jgi:OmcA/MtrC family decaheme c-type cytochrome
VQDTNCPYAPEQQVGALGAHVYGYIAQGALLEHAGGSGAELPAGSHVHLYDDVASAALAYGTAVAGSAGAYESMANVAGCEKCHGQPYMKHGYRDPIVASLPDFASCKSCHYDDRNGGHEDWQYMVDDPFNWATAGLPNVQVEATYAYKAKLMNDVHMAHAMEFPYPQSMSNCATCHEGKLNLVLANTNFTAETCLSCHPVQGTDAWPGESYAQGHRAPALEYLWTLKGVQGFHNPTLDCQQCHGSVAIPTALPFDQLHTGYDVNITNANGEKYSDLYTVSIDQITRSGVSGELLTINFSANEPAIVPEVLVSFYGWDSRNFLIPSHARDGSTLCTSRGNPTGCRMEFAPGDINPLFTEDAASVPGDWMVTLDMAAFQAAETADILTLIANGEVKKVEITVTPELNLADIGGADVDVVLDAAGQTFDLGASMVVNDYFKGANAAVDTNKCDVCHDSLASSFHDGRGRGGGGIQVCKNCHNPTFTGSHVEMASRSIDNYVHAIHSFQDFDPGDTFEVFDPVLAKRYDQHINHVFPNFTIRNCEACHLDTPVNPVTYNVPDQSKSMPGAQSQSDNPLTWYEMVGSGGLIPSSIAVEDPAGRNIGFVPEVVVGPASRACGGCHRARNINDDLAGDLAAFNAHTEAGGTFVENDDDDIVLFGIIDKIMSLFE